MNDDVKDDLRQQITLLAAMWGAGSHSCRVSSAALAEIVDLNTEVARLRALVEAAYRAGWVAGNSRFNGDSEMEDVDWESSRIRAALTKEASE
jgi:hypothetical protein